MMHPLNKKNFGPNGLAIRFHNGVGVVFGYIVKQVGLSSYIVTDGTVTKKVFLAQNANDAANISGSIATISGTANSQTVYVKSITMNKAFTVQGTTLKWGVTGSPSLLLDSNVAPVGYAFVTTNGKFVTINNGANRVLVKVS